MKVLKKTAQEVKDEIKSYTSIVKEIDVDNIKVEDVNKTSIVKSGLSLLVTTIEESPEILENLQNDPSEYFFIKKRLSIYLASFLFQISHAIQCSGFQEDLNEATNAANDAITEIEESEGLSLGYL